jgi:hypothetical protein
MKVLALRSLQNVLTDAASAFGNRRRKIPAGPGFFSRFIAGVNSSIGEL